MMKERAIPAVDVIDGLSHQLRALAVAADLASDPTKPLDAVYDAVERCMDANTGLVRMTSLYDSIIASAVSIRDTERGLQRRGEDGAFVYFIQREDGLIKIGYSYDPEARLCQLQTMHQCSMTLLTKTPGALARERSLHAKFATSRVTGEWFNPSEDLLQFISEIAAS